MGTAVEVRWRRDRVEHGWELFVARNIVQHVAELLHHISRERMVESEVDAVDWVDGVD